MLAEGGLLIAVSWSPVLPRGLQPANASLPGSAAANACFRLLKNQPQQRHRWPPPTAPASYFTSIRPPQGFRPSLLAISPSVLAPPTTRALERCGRQFASSRVRQKKGLCHVPLMVPGKGRPAVGTGRGCSWTLSRPEEHPSPEIQTAGGQMRCSSMLYCGMWEEFCRGKKTHPTRL